MPPPPGDAPSPTPEPAYVQLISKHQRHLHSYIRTLVPTHADADDVMQETSLTLWQKREQYDNTRDFFPWACGVALIQVLRHRQRKATDKLWFNEEVLAQLAAQMEEDANLFEFRREALDGCIEKLSPSEKRVLELRYREGSTWEALAAQIDHSTRSAQRTMARVRRLLHRCIAARLREWQVG